MEFPTVVQDLLTQYADLFANEPERRHFAEYLIGLFIAERKTVSAINRAFAVTTDQSCRTAGLSRSIGMTPPAAAQTAGSAIGFAMPILFSVSDRGPSA
ncbi:MAG: hypothetical protein IPO81_16490 [Kouleothrix sp.]|nr:hypothetical protein [Kouleothrix sp.]